MRADLTLPGLEDFPEDPDRMGILHHGIRHEVRGDDAELIEQLLQRRKAVGVIRRSMARRNDSPLIFFYINCDNQSHHSLQGILNRPRG